MKRVLYYSLAPAVCLALFWRVLLTWFNTDDFSLLWLASTVHDLPTLGYALFHPIAQGTVRAGAALSNPYNYGYSLPAFAPGLSFLFPLSFACS